VSKVTRRRLGLVAGAVAILFAVAGSGAAADTPAYLPLVLSRAASLMPVTPAPSPPAVAWSGVLARVPVYPGARLDFFEVQPQSAPSSGFALYSARSAPATAIEAWYRDILPGLGWRLVETGQGFSRWLHYDGWLEVGVVKTGDGIERLRLARALAAVASPQGLVQQPSVPLPAGLVRWRYDRSDLLSEELRTFQDPAAVRDALAGTLGTAGWVADGEVRLGAVWLTRFVRGEEALLSAVRPLPDGSAEIGIGVTGCLPSATVAAGEEHATSIYLAGVPAPPGARLVSYEQQPQPSERWEIECQDLDLAAVLYRDRFETAGWRPVVSAESSDGVRREPAALSLQLASPDDEAPITVSLVPLGGGRLALTLTRDGSGRAKPAGHSLLFGDLPLPDGSDALRLERDLPDGWSFREHYRLSDAMAKLAPSWFRHQMASPPWQFERLEPAVSGSAQVYYGGGEELVVAFGNEDGPAVIVSRRRVCASDRPHAPSPVGQPARRLLEVPVYPGATYDGFRDPEERYRATCADLGVMADWYRTAMERGDWVLAATEGPQDPLERRLLFVRPGELGVLPALRTAWAEVVLSRPWPYHYRIDLRRDPAGIGPSPWQR
jgi:hypothetical protein